VDFDTSRISLGFFVTALFALYAFAVLGAVVVFLRVTRNRGSARPAGGRSRRQHQQPAAK
jgi:hypothetical protein